MGSPLMQMLLEVVADRLPDRIWSGTETGRRIASWSDRAYEDALPLRLAGGLHALVRSGMASALAASYSANDLDPERLALAIVATIEAHDGSLCGYLDGPPQTNEVARSSMLLGAALRIAERTGLPLAWYEIGASAGLNQNFDRFRYELGVGDWGAVDATVRIRSTWRGSTPELSTPLQVVDRAACDLQPLDAESLAHRERLLSYVWADQHERLQRLVAALDLASALGVHVAREPASSFVDRTFSAPPQDGLVRVLVHTVVWQYLPEAEREAIRRALEAAGARANERSPVAWFSVEADEAPGSAAMNLTIFPTGQRTLVGRCDFHGRWVDWAR